VAEVGMSILGKMKDKVTALGFMLLLAPVQSTAAETATKALYLCKMDDVCEEDTIVCKKGQWFVIRFHPDDGTYSMGSRRQTVTRMDYKDLIVFQSFETEDFLSVTIAPDLSVARLSAFFTGIEGYVEPRLWASVSRGKCEVAKPK